MSDTTNMGLNIVQNFGAEARHGICHCFTTSNSQHFVIVNSDPKVAYAGHFNSPKFAYKRQSLSFCILCCITNFTIALCTVPVFNYHFNDSMFSEDFIWHGKLFQTLGAKTLKLLLVKVTWLSLVYSNSTYIFLEQVY